MNNEAINVKLEKRIIPLPSYTAADQLAANVELHAAHYESEVNKSFPEQEALEVIVTEYVTTLILSHH